MKSRSLGLIFVAAVIVPSILLAVLSVRAAGREEAFVERQLATTLDAETARAAGLANAEVGRIVDELQAGIDIPAGASYGAVLRRWKAGNALVDVPFLLSPRYGILWPAGSGSGDAERRFLRDQGDFLSDRTATTILQNIADRYQKQILAGAATASAPATTAAADRSTVAPGPAAEPSAQGAAAAPSALKDSQSSTTNRQMALDAFAQSPAIQSEVYQAAAEKGDQLSARVAQPVSKALSNAPAMLPAVAPSAAAAAAPAASKAPAAASDATAPEAEKSAEAVETTSAAAGGAAGAAASETAAVATSPQAAVTPSPQAAVAQSPQAIRAQSQRPQSQPSQYVVTSQLLSQIASEGRAGVIPRFTNTGLVFLFWERQADGRIAGCQITGSLFRARISAVLEGTTTASRIITFLDENGTPLAAPPGDTGRDWRRPFVSREIGASLPRWEAAAYLTDPDAISSQARSTSLVIWIMVLILFVSVAGGGSLVLSSVYAEVRTAQQKATFVTNVSHELKTPLTSISLFVELLRKKGPLSAAKRESYLSHMASETERLTRLINNVLDFSGTRRYAMESLDAAAVASEVLEGQRVRLESLGFTVTMAPSRAPCIVRADPGALKQVLLNLLSNAEKYSRARREVDVRVESALEPGRGQVFIHVLDRGIGIPDKERERIFREFYRVDDALASRVRGTGLGLTIARRIARDHGGDITCAPRDGGGSDFTVRLPGVSEGEEG